jgi:hypothetical protein
MTTSFAGQRFHKERSAEAATGAVPRRTVKQLLRDAETRAKERKHIEARMRAEAKASQEREVAIAREKHLRGLVDLRVLDARGGDGDFKLRMKTLRQVHSRKPSFIKRLGKAEL